MGNPNVFRGKRRGNVCVRSRYCRIRGDFVKSFLDRAKGVA